MEVLHLENEWCCCYFFFEVIDNYIGFDERRRFQFSFVVHQRNNPSVLFETGRGERERATYTTASTVAENTSAGVRHCFSPRLRKTDKNTSAISQDCRRLSSGVEQKDDVCSEMQTVARVRWRHVQKFSS